MTDGVSRHLLCQARRPCLLDESEDVAHGLLKGLLVDSVLADREVADDILEIVVERVVLGREVAEELSSQVGNVSVLVLDALGHLAELAFDLDHAVQDQVIQDHQSVLLDVDVPVS